MPEGKPVGASLGTQKTVLDIGTEAVGAAEVQGKVPVTEPQAGESPEVPAASAGSDDSDMKLDAPSEPVSVETKSEETAASTAPIPAARTSVPDDERDVEDGDGQLAPNQAVDQAKRKEEDAKLTRLAEEEKIIASKQYYLPISGVEKQRRSLDRVVLALVIVVLLCLVWLDVVLDAGIIKLGGIQPLTHLFRQ